MSRSSTESQSPQSGEGSVQKKNRPFLMNQAVAIVGDYGEDLPLRRLGKIVERMGAIYVEDESPMPTHLICTAAEFAVPGKKVKSAIRRGPERCHIVSFQWLKDSIRRNTKLPEEEYRLPNTDNSRRLRTKLRKEWRRGVEDGVRFINRNLFHALQDKEGFSYEVTLMRNDPENEIEGERYVLYLFESNAKPHLYWFAAKHYKKKGATFEVYRPSETQQLRDGEMELFTDFFQKKTGVKWDERLVKDAGPGFFAYERPRLGRPVGFIEEPKNLPNEYNVALLETVVRDAVEIEDSNLDNDGAGNGEVDSESPMATEHVEEDPAEENPAEVNPSEKMLAEETPAEKTPAEETPAEETPAAEKLAEDKLAEDKPVEDKPTEDKPTEDKPAEDTPPGKKPGAGTKRSLKLVSGDGAGDMAPPPRPIKRNKKAGPVPTQIKTATSSLNARITIGAVSNRTPNATKRAASEKPGPAAAGQTTSQTAAAETPRHAAPTGPSDKDAAFSEEVDAALEAELHQMFQEAVVEEDQ